MAYIGPAYSVVSFQGNPSVLQAVVAVTNFPTNPSISGAVSVSNLPVSQNVNGSVIAQVSNFPTNPSISGTVNVGNLPVTQNISGSVIAQLISSNASVITVGSPVANQSVSGSVGIVGIPMVEVIGSVAVSVTPVANQSVSGAVSISNFPTTQNVSGSVVAVGNVGAGVVDSGNPVKMGGKYNASTVTLLDLQRGDVQLDANGNQKMVGTVTVTALQGHSVSGTVAVSNLPTTQNVSGSVVAFVSGLQGSSISGTVLVNNGSVVAFQGTSPWVMQSIVGTYAEDSAHTTADKGFFVMGVRNDAVASFSGANGEYNPFGHDSAGRMLTKPFAPEEARIEGYNSVVSTSVTTLVAAAGTGLKNYITDVVLVNTGATTTLITFRSGG